MNYLDFKKNLENGNVFTAYLLVGEEGFFRVKALQMLKSLLITEPSINLVYFNGESLKDKSVEADFFASLSSLPFLSQYRITVVNEFYPKAETLKRLTEVLSNGLEKSILIIVNEKDKESEGLKKIKEISVVECKRAEKFNVTRWIKSTCESAGVSIEMETAALLAEYCLLDMVRVSTETEKLISYAINKKVIDKEDLDLLVYRDSEYKIYQMTDYIAKKKIGLALGVVYELLNKGEPQQRLLGSIYNYFRKLLHVAISSLPEAELKKELNISDKAFGITKQQANGFRKVSLKKAVDVLEDADFRFKSGKTDINEEFYNSLFRILISK